MFRGFLSIKKIKELIKLLEGSDIDELEVGSFGRKIRIKKSTLASCQKLPVQTTSEKKNQPPKLVTIKSPMVGTFHLAPSPDSKPDDLKLLKVGQKIEKDQLIYAIEAMLIINEFKSETNGTIVEILVEAKAPVQFGQSLFLIDPQ